MAFVHRAVGGGTGDISNEAAGNFGLLIGAVEACMRQAREMEATLGALADESLALGASHAKGSGCAIGGGGGLFALGSHTSAVAAALMATGQAQTALAGGLPGAVVEVLGR